MRLIILFSVFFSILMKGKAQLGHIFQLPEQYATLYNPGATAAASDQQLLFKSHQYLLPQISRLRSVIRSEMFLAYQWHQPLKPHSFGIRYNHFLIPQYIQEHELGANYSYRFQVREASFLSLGIGLNVLQQHSNLSPFSANSQINQVIKANIDLGFWYQTPRFEIGFSGRHLNNWPYDAILDSYFIRPPSLYFNVQYKWQITKQVTFNPNSILALRDSGGFISIGGQFSFRDKVYLGGQFRPFYDYGQSPFSFSLGGQFINGVKVMLAYSKTFISARDLEILFIYNFK